MFAGCFQDCFRMAFHLAFGNQGDWFKHQELPGLLAVVPQ
jgi:hypothetical protein